MSAIAHNLPTHSPETASLVSQQAVLTTSDPAAADADDLRLARAAAAGDAHAFEQLYRRHVSRIRGLCWRLVNGDDKRADQATQDAFVRAWEKLGSFRGDSQFSTWLHRLTVNLVLGEYRLMKRWVTFEDVAEAAGDEGDGVPVDEHPQQQTADRMDLEKALAKLPPGARSVLLLHDVEGYQHDEISELTGIAVGTSKAQLHRARKLMRGFLQ
ncbi:RNA polymerase sigma factor [Hydrocarboniphaga sp.]|uniref:RNA polymerase sigma factor n=1 Tax=Hydrocarboniphaga sp. TaxID=2033016 RepID=UPI003D0E1C82